MNVRLSAVCAFLLILMWIGAPAYAHRLDEYLQATTISLEQGRVRVQMRLTAGVAVFRSVFAGMDTNGDGILSEVEQKAYAERMPGDVSLAVDNTPLRPRLVSWKFPKTAEMKAGRGDIQLDFTANVPQGGSSRKLIFENHHQAGIAVYLVNCLVPCDPNIQVTAQKRDYRQSRYELDFVQAGDVPSSPMSSGERTNVAAGSGMAVLLLAVSLTWLWRRRAGALQGRASSPTKTAASEGKGV